MSQPMDESGMAMINEPLRECGKTTVIRLHHS